MRFWARARSVAMAAACLSGFLLSGAAQGLDLDAAERIYLAKLDTVSFCVDPDWPPFEWLDAQGRHQGIAADLLRLAAERAGIRIRLVPTRDWDESLALSRSGGCTLLSFLNRTPRREEWLSFTRPIFTDPNVFITREEHAFIADPAALSDETVAFPAGTAMEELIRRDYPNLKVRITDTEDEAIALVSSRKADMTMRSLIVAAYTIKKDGLFNLKIAGQLPTYTNQLRVGVAKDEPLLRDILDKAIATITPEERGRIVNDHVSIKVETATDYGPILKLAAGFAAIAAIGLFYHTRLRRLNRELERVSNTDSLTGIANRMRLDTRLAAEIARARRYDRPLAIVMFDLDHFKQVNDRFGHLMGDRALIAAAEAAQRSLRTSDLVGRWGGEEFLVVCPETRLDEAVCVAERIRTAIGGIRFAHGRDETVSVGVAALRDADTADSLLLRCDAALYAAKDAGRNRVRREADAPSAPPAV